MFSKCQVFVPEISTPSFLKCRIWVPERSKAVPDVSKLYGKEANFESIFCLQSRNSFKMILWQVNPVDDPCYANCRPVISGTASRPAPLSATELVAILLVIALYKANEGTLVIGRFALGLFAEPTSEVCMQGVEVPAAIVRTQVS